MQYRSSIKVMTVWVGGGLSYMQHAKMFFISSSQDPQEVK